ncbi:PaaI family thioesterase [Temperatibacter marinus]|uniref:PaaI family thioesterase n=1 Tax=Temperatibacter marinus TaxID=1456591 RepID=A0AA52HAB1_9PROT|nr:PaaI family thioesterase [Temperatibacter marinus]WND02555.1 PaaI family thioesterase [Temperatibacter marinus]
MTTVQDLRDQGYHTWDMDIIEPFEENNGPFLMKKQEDGSWVTALVVEEKHLNGHKTIHGGALMTLADVAIFAFARDLIVGEFNAVTVSMTADFLKGAQVGDLIEGKGQVTRETGSMIFSSGGLFVGDECLLNFSGIIKKLEKKKG